MNSRLVDDRRALPQHHEHRGWPPRHQHRGWPPRHKHLEGRGVWGAMSGPPI